MKSLALVMAGSLAVSCAKDPPPTARPTNGTSPSVLDVGALADAARGLNHGPVLNHPVAGMPSPCNGVRVNTPEELNATLSRPDFQGCVIIPRDAALDMSGFGNILLRSNVQLVGERGELGSRPTIYAKTVVDPTAQAHPTLFKITGNNVVVEGIRFIGPETSREITHGVEAITVLADFDQQLGRHVTIANNEFTEWNEAAVFVTSTHGDTPLSSDYDNNWARPSKDDAGLIEINGNFFHDNSMNSLGYGVNVEGGVYATIEGNVFDFNRHSIAADGQAYSGYIARFNYDLAGGYEENGYYNQHFDVHGTGPGHYGGTAGVYYEIAFNAFRGNQGYECYLGHCYKTRPAFELRGTPTDGAYFTDNVAVQTGLDSAVSLKSGKDDTGIGEDEGKFHFHASDNTYDTDHSSDLATGDFDGDGRTDVFVGTGTAWFISRGGVAPWEFLHASTKLANQLGFADIDNDGTTDVLYRDDNGNVGYLKSGVGDLSPLTTSPVPLADMRFGDFDGDHKTDMFYTLNGQWHIWYGKTRTWTNTQTSSFPVSALRFGEFDPIPGTDVVAVTDDEWAYSSAATSRWTRLNAKLKPSLADSVVADFDGDGKSDIAFDDGNQTWSYSPGGRRPLQNLRRGAAAPAYPALTKLLVGAFDGGKRAEALGFEPTPPAFPPVPPDPLTDYFVIWRGEIAGGFDGKSSWPMR